MELLRSFETFTSPKIIGGLALPILLPEFSFSAWVSLDAQFARGYIVRKRLGSAGLSSGLACFGWNIDRLHGQALHFGASDFYPTKREDSTQEGKKQETVTLDSKFEFVPDQFYLLTLVVSFDPIAQKQTVTFYRDLTELGCVLPQGRDSCVGAEIDAKTGLADDSADAKRWDSVQADFLFAQASDATAAYHRLLQQPGPMPLPSLPPPASPPHPLAY